MAHSDSEEEQETFEDVEDDNEDDLAESENLEAAEEGTEEGDDDSPSEDTEDGSEDAEEDDSEPAVDITGDLLNQAFAEVEANAAQSSSNSPEIKSEQQSKAPSPAPSLRLRKRPISPAGARKKALRLAKPPTGLTVEAVCAIPHPVPTNALAASQCMTHLLTGSEDGYIRDYDIFTALNGKNFLSAPQRHHSGVVEGLMKAVQHRFWWDNNLPSTVPGIDEDRNLVPVYSLAMHSDALWALAGTDSGHINLFTLRHEPGRLCHTLVGHRDLVSSLSLNHDEKSLFSASWDGEAIQWDLNTGQKSRIFTSHGAQLTCIAVRPENAVYTETGSPIIIKYEDDMNDTHPSDPSAAGISRAADSDAKSDASFDPLFDDEPEDGGKPLANGASKPGLSTIAPPKGAPPLLDHQRYKTFSPDILMTAAIDGQIMLWDKRVNTVGQGVGRLWMTDKTPPWCLSACWSADGNQIYAGRRNGTVEIYDVRHTGRTTPRLLKILRNPSRSGVVSSVVGFPDNRHIACASIDNIRLWNAEAIEPDTSVRAKGGTQFKVIPGHHGGFISQMLVDSGCRLLISSSSNKSIRDSPADSTRTVFIHDIQHVK